MLSHIANSTVGQTIANTAAVLTASANKTAATVAVITVHDQPIRFVADGSTPTTAVGDYATAGDKIVLFSQSEIAGFKAIREGGTSATVTVQYYSGDPTETDLANLRGGL